MHKTLFVQLKYYHGPILVVTLQIGVKKAIEIPQISRALAHARHVVTHFYHSSYILKQKQTCMLRN